MEGLDAKTLNFDWLPVYWLGFGTMVTLVLNKYLELKCETKNEQEVMADRLYFHRTERCLLAETIPEDMITFAEWFTEYPDFYRYLSANKAIFEASNSEFLNILTRSYAKNIASSDVISITIKSRINPRTNIGYVDLLQNDEVETDEFMLSIFLAKNHTGNGFGKEIISGVCNMVFKDEVFSNFNKISLTVYPKNVGAVICYIQCGFVPSDNWNIGIDVNSWEYQICKYVDFKKPILMSLSREKWNSESELEADFEQVQTQINLYLAACQKFGLTLLAKSDTNI